MKKLFAALALLVCTQLCHAQSKLERPCRSVDENAHIAISEASARVLATIGIDRAGVMSAIRETSVPESGGCWGGIAGNFDGQRVSAGLAQWNYGQKSLQPLLRAYKKSLYPSERFVAEIERLMPKFGRKVFSEGCLRQVITAECEEFLASQQIGIGGLNTDFRVEFGALFESDPMTQIQVDEYVKLLTSVASDLERVFPGLTKTPLRIKWAIDMKVQQGGFPGNADIKRVRTKWEPLSKDARRVALSNIFRWYEGLCLSLDQDGVRHDCAFNVSAWTSLNTNDKISHESADLLLLSHLKSRVASNQAGLYQALAFQRRAKIALGVGSVHGRRDPLPRVSGI